MTRGPTFDPVEYLLQRRHADAPAWLQWEQRRRALEGATKAAKLAASINVNQVPPMPDGLARIVGHEAPGDPARWEEIQKDRAALQAMSGERLTTLVAEEARKEKAEQEERAKRIEAGRFFNAPNAVADFEHYCLLANWTLDEAVALSFGKNPEVVNWKTVAPLVNVSPFARAYSLRRDMFARAKWAQQLFDPVMPSIFLAWAKPKLQLPEELLNSAVDSGLSLKGWHELHQESERQWRSEVERLTRAHSDQIEAARSSLAACRRRISELENQLRQTPSQNPERPLGKRERENLRMLALVAAIRGYAYDPDQRTGAIKEIVADLERVDHPFSDDRIREHLREAANDLRPDWRARLKLKPNKGSG